MVCGAPRSRSSGGRSAVSTTSGIREQLRLDDGGPELHRGGPGRGEQDDRPAARAGDAQREEAGGPLVEQHPDPKARGTPERERERRGPGPGADHRLADPGGDELSRERRQQACVAHASSPGMPSAATTARSLIRDSSHS